MKRSLLLTSFALLSTLTAGCGSLASDTDNPEPLAVLHGELTNPESVLLSSNVRVAVIWNCGDTDTMYRATQEVEVKPVFPSRFRLELTEPPPAGCMLDPFAEEDHNDDPPQVGGSGGSPSGPGDPDVPPSTPQGLTGAAGAARMGIGTIAAYEDLNGNGKLDLVDPGAPEYVDRVVGTNESLLLVYVEGTIPQSWDEIRDSDGNLPGLGYNLLEFSEPIATPQSGDVAVAYCGYPTGSSGGTVPGDGATPADPGATPMDEPVPVGEEPIDQSDYAGPSLHWMSADTFFVLTMTADPQFVALMCRDGGLGSESSGGSTGVPVGQPIAVPAQYPLPGDPGLSCSSDGLSYYYETCVEQGVCAGKMCMGECWYVPDPANPPAGWPCAMP